MPLNNTDIVNGVRNRDKHVFEVIFNQFSSAMFSIALRYLRDQDEAQDIVQDVFLNLWRTADNLDERAPIQHYLARATVNTCLNRIKKTQRQQQYTKEQQLTSTELTVEHLLLEHKELEAQYLSILEKLPEQCRRVFEMSRFKGLSPTEISQQLNISINTVYTHLTTALKKIRLGLLNQQ
ncbi:RNA polymerase sigma-70 factor [Chitinophaga ginsengisoli]|uniref:RNA polymerase sigma-70 factor (ECF subfamily) n=1 Tax=Chitinophaga ginsengisoli TaxID=363837 RepID=A0A2P8FT85_9BACT|nr:RNA polymerase sigma-70 factor [Chitinophaga ginsengisoli]PSL24936.1 RNA polymerase sigma-70 factor (ECF subfamily) [Chitinophaga ginsengisoli]